MKGIEHFSTWLAEIIQKAEGIELIANSNHINAAQFVGWTTQAEALILSLLRNDHIYYLRFEVNVPAHGAGKVYGAYILRKNDARHPSLRKRGLRQVYRSQVYQSSLTACLQILRSLQEDLTKGRLTSLRTLVTAEVFSDFLDMAEHLLNNGYKDASASLIGAVLERELRDLASSNGLSVRDRDDLTSLNNKMAEKNVFSRIIQKNLSVWIAIRNEADHGKFEGYSQEQVKDMLSGVRLFLSQHQST